MMRDSIFVYLLLLGYIPYYYSLEMITPLSIPFRYSCNRTRQTPAFNHLVNHLVKELAGRCHYGCTSLHNLL